MRKPALSDEAIFARAAKEKARGEIYKLEPVREREPMTKPVEPSAPRKHKHRWSEPYRNIFKGPVRVCENGPCGAIRLATGRIIVMRDGTKIIGSSE